MSINHLVDAGFHEPMFTRIFWVKPRQCHSHKRQQAHQGGYFFASKPPTPQWGWVIYVSLYAYGVSWRARAERCPSLESLVLQDNQSEISPCRGGIGSSAPAVFSLTHSLTHWMPRWIRQTLLSSYFESNSHLWNRQALLPFFWLIYQLSYLAF